MATRGPALVCALGFPAPLHPGSTCLVDRRPRAPANPPSHHRASPPAATSSCPCVQIPCVQLPCRRATECVDDAGPSRGVISDVLLGAPSGEDAVADQVVVIGAGGGGGGDKVVTGGLGEEEDRVVLVGEGRGEKKLGKEKGCVEGVGEGIGEAGCAQQGDGDDEEEEVVVAVEKATLVPDFD